MTTVQEIMRSVSEVLTTAEELNAEGDGEQVGIMLASFLRTLLVDLDRLGAEQPQYMRRTPMPKREAQGRPPKKGKPKRPVINKYDGDCTVCDRHVGKGAGFVLPNDGLPKGKRWETYCQDHNPY